TRVKPLLGSRARVSMTRWLRASWDTAAPSAASAAAPRSTRRRHLPVLSGSLSKRAPPRFLAGLGQGTKEAMGLDELHARRLATIGKMFDAALDRMEQVLHSLEECADGGEASRMSAEQARFI